MEEKPLSWIEEIGIDYVSKDDTESLKKFLVNIKKILRNVCLECTKKGNMETVGYFNTWGIRESLSIMKSAASNNNIDLCCGLAYERWRCNIMVITAARNGHIDLVKEMIKRGADEIDRVGRIAAEIGNVDILILALDTHKCYIPDIIRIAQSNNHMEISRMILEKY